MIYKAKVYHIYVGLQEGKSYILGGILYPVSGVSFIRRHSQNPPLAIDQPIEGQFLRTALQGFLGVTPCLEFLSCWSLTHSITMDATWIFQLTIPWNQGLRKTSSHFWVAVPGITQVSF